MIATPGMEAVEHEVVIQPPAGWVPVNLHEVWEYRELLYFLAWRDVKVRYKQTALGAAWAILQPLLTMLVFTLFFGGLAKVGSDGMPYPIFSYAGLLPWTLFAEGVARSSQSLVASSNLIKKVYFPRLIVPASAIMAGLLDFTIAFGVLIGLMAYYGIWPSAAILFLPLLLMLVLAIGLGVGIWLAALNVEYRDVRYVVPFFIQMWLFVTPVIYPASKVVAKLQSMGVPPWLYGLNPMAGVVEGFRWALLGRTAVPVSLIVASIFAAIVILVSGAFYFRRMEKTFADLV